MEKITSSHPLSQSTDIVKENLETLKRLFPTIIKEGRIDVDELKALLDEEIETNEEYYRFSWVGKSDARREANKPSTATLRPNQPDSKNWDTTGNVFIEGDNLEVLKLLQKSYSGRIKMIYIDPPYNTGKDFVYKDNYADNLGNYLALTGQTDEEGKKLSSNTESDGRYHSNWLNMMYPRLKLARNLMTEDGVIFISIDDNEVHNLRKLCDELFGEENFVAQIVWEKRYGRSNDQKFFSSITDYLLLYKKTNDLKYLRELRSEKSNDIYTNPDDDSRGVWTSVSFVSQRTKEERPNLSYEITNPNTGELFSHEVNSWKYSEDKYKELSAENRLYWGKDGNQKQPRIKRFLSELSDGLVPINLWKHQEVGTGEVGTKEVDLLVGKEIFTFPKPTTLIKKTIEIGTASNDIILDFFAGSGSTAHAVMVKNVEDKSNRKFICVQLPEPTDEKTEAYKAGYTNIAQITKERIRRAGEKILTDKTAELDKLKKAIEGKMLVDEEQEAIDNLQLTINNLDIGFKAFKLDSSNINAWDGNVADFDGELFKAEHNIKTDRTIDDVLFEVLLKYGLDLTVPIEENTFHGCKVHCIGGGKLFVCLSENITVPVAIAIAKWKATLQPEICRVLFRDNGFADDIAKTNSVQVLRQNGVEEVNTI